MSWSTIADRWLFTIEWLGGLAAVFAILARLWPCNPGMYWWKDLRAVCTDVVYWFLVPLLMLLGRAVLLIVAVALFFGGAAPAGSFVTAWPIGMQVLAVLLIQDLWLYWLHRLFHTRAGWQFHAIHHSPCVLDWTACARFHPVNQLLEFALADVVVLLLGFPPVVLLVVAPFNLVYSAMVHANLNWTFGPLRYLLASPVFHRWHHTTEVEGLDKNFASTFPFLDLLFGTFYLPVGKRPERFGAGETPVPVGFCGQLVQPFARTGIARWAALGSLLLAVAAFGGWDYVAVRLGTANSPRLEDQAIASPGKPSTPLVATQDGRIQVWGDEAGRVHVRNTGTGLEQIAPAKHGRRVASVALSADGQRVVSGGADGTLQLWVRGGSGSFTTMAHAGGVGGVALSPDGRHIVSGGRDGQVRVWNPTGQPELVLPAEGAISSVAVSPDGMRIVAAFRSQAKLWDRASGRESHFLGHTDLVGAVAFSPDGTRVVTRGFDGQVKTWDADTGEELR